MAGLLNTFISMLRVYLHALLLRTTAALCELGLAPLPTLPAAAVAVTAAPAAEKTCTVMGMQKNIANGHTVFPYACQRQDQLSRTARR
jgi:hypothetical protein